MTQIITNSMPIGVPGDLSRQAAVVEAYQNFITTPVLSYGLPVKISATPDAVTGIVAADTSAAVVGFAVRKFYGYQRLSGSENFGAGTPPDGPIDVLKEGYIVVRCNNGTPVKEGSVHVRIAVPSGQRVIGGIEAVADGVNTFALTGAAFTGAVDAEGNAEIRFRVGN
jgi:hypothetical protein